jgi:hypothetical protein
MPKTVSEAIDLDKENGMLWYDAHTKGIEECPSCFQSP